MSLFIIIPLKFILYYTNNIFFCQDFFSVLLKNAKFYVFHIIYVVIFFRKKGDIVPANAAADGGGVNKP